MATAKLVRAVELSPLTSHHTPLLHEALRGTASARHPREAARALLDACINALGAQGGCVYLLDLTSSLYQPFVGSSNGDRDDGVRARAGALDIPVGHLCGRDSFFRSIGGPPVSAPGIVVYAFRGRSCVGAIRLDGPELASIEPALQEDLLACSNLLVSVYENEFAYNLLGSLQEPLDFTKSDDEVFSDLALRISASSRMQYVVLWEFYQDRLECLALWGFGDDVNLRDWDLEPVSDYPAFHQALHGQTVAVENMSSAAHAKIAEKWWAKPLGSLVAVPIRVGTGIFGILSVAAACTFEFSALEQRGFESIANGFGVAITNCRNSRVLSGRASEYAEAAVAITAMEVASASRHEVIGYVDNCQLGLSAIRRKIPERSRALVEPELVGVSEQLTRIAVAANKTKFALKPREFKWRRTTLVSLWDDARTAVLGRLQAEGITVHYSGPTAIDVLAQ
ncbi:MAG: GAF domain-containing protein, partial [Solirubrobacteraceae bacterium]